MPYPYDIHNINKRSFEDPEGFVRECEAVFNRKVDEAAATIAEKGAASHAHVVFLSGPSGSGKTTTAQKICDSLEGIGIHASTVSLDRYYTTPNPETSPKTENGEYDLESPFCLDLKLLAEHFATLERGDEAMIPHFNFETQTRIPEKATPLKLSRDEVVIFEGIHALNDMLTEAHPSAFKLYISARSDVNCDGETHFKRTWTRLLRRVVRDELFRGTGVMETLKMWAIVRDGEKKYISPYKYKADFLFDSSMGYEVTVLKRHALRAFSEIPDDIPRSAELRALLPVLLEFEEIDPRFVPTDSILREFIGGGIYGQ